MRKKALTTMGILSLVTEFPQTAAKFEKLSSGKIRGRSDIIFGLAGCYRRFIKGFGAIAQILTKKTNKNAIKELFVRTKEEEVAFTTLRTFLKTEPISSYPEFFRQFLFFTDACNYGIGAILSQIHHKDEVIIAYASRQIKKVKMNYVTTERCYPLL